MTKPFDRRLAITVLTALVFLITCRETTAAGANPPSPTEVKCVYPHRGEITRSIVLPGNVRAYQQATLYAKVAGYLKSINVDNGDLVKAGAVLAEIETPELSADLAKYQAEAKVAEIDLKRLDEAQKKAPDLVVPLTVDSARSKYEVAKASLDRIETLLGYNKVIAPFSGIITMRYVDPGAFIPAATSGSAANTAAIVTLMDFNRVRVQVAVPELESALVARGQPVKVVVEEYPKGSFEGEITRFSYALDEATKTMLAEIELPNPKLELRPGMYATVKIGIERKTDVLLLPVEGLVMEKANAFVFTVVENRAKKVPIKTGFNDGTSVEIISDLTPAERVILAGKQALSDGQLVRVVEGK
jgi:membrane fusion protein (multidrug efflux system)